MAMGMAKTTDANVTVNGVVHACGKIVYKQKENPYANTHDAQNIMLFCVAEISYVHNDFLVQFSTLVQFACLLCSCFLFSFSLHFDFCILRECTQWRKVRYLQGYTHTHTILRTFVPVALSSVAFMI